MVNLIAILFFLLFSWIFVNESGTRTLSSDDGLRVFLESRETEPENDDNLV